MIKLDSYSHTLIILQVRFVGAVFYDRHVTCIVMSKRHRPRDWRDRVIYIYLSDSFLSALISILHARDAKKPRPQNGCAIILSVNILLNNR